MVWSGLGLAVAVAVACSVRGLMLMLMLSVLLTTAGGKGTACGGLLGTAGPHQRYLNPLYRP